MDACTAGGMNLHVIDGRPLDAICVLGKGVERTPARAGPVWRPTRYIEKLSDSGQHTGLRAIGIRPDDDRSMIAGSNANVLAAAQLCAELYRDGSPPRLLIFPSGRPAYLASHPDPTLTEARILAERFVRACRRAGIGRTEILILGRSRNTHEEVRDALSCASDRAACAMAVITTTVHLPRAREFMHAVIEENPALSRVATRFLACEEILQRRYARFARLCEALSGCADSAAYRRSEQSEQAGIDALRRRSYRYS